MPRSQFSIRTLLLLVALTAVCLSIHRVYQSWYVQSYTLHSLHSFLSTGINNGDSFDKVAGHFETAAKVDIASNDQVRDLWKYKGWAIQPHDEIWHFIYSKGRGVWIQFRDGRVVNFRASDFADPDRNARVNREPVPPLLLRHGIWPLCLAIFVVGSCVLVALDKRARGASSPQSRDQQPQ